MDEQAFPRVCAALAKSDRQTGLLALGLGVAGVAFVAAQFVLPGLPQLGVVGAVIVGLVSIAASGFGAWTLSRAGRLNGHPNLVHAGETYLRLLEQELEQEPEVWGEFSFTPSFLIGPGFLPIPLDDIVWTYRKVTKSASGIEKKNEMFLFLVGGAEERFVADAGDIEPAFDCVVERRPSVQVGHDLGLERRWKANAKATASELVAQRTG